MYVCISSTTDHRVETQLCKIMCPWKFQALSPEIFPNDCGFQVLSFQTSQIAPLWTGHVSSLFFVVTLAWRGHWGVGSTSLAGDGFLVILEVTQGHQGRSEQQTMATPVFKSKNDTVKTWRQQNQQGLSAPHKFPVHGSEFMETWCADSWGSVGPHSIW